MESGAVANDMADTVFIREADGGWPGEVPECTACAEASGTHNDVLARAAKAPRQHAPGRGQRETQRCSNATSEQDGRRVRLWEGECRWRVAVGRNWQRWLVCWPEGTALPGKAPREIKGWDDAGWAQGRQHAAKYMQVGLASHPRRQLCPS